MIDESEAVSRVYTLTHGSFGVVAFTADDDLTLRQVHLTDGSLSSDPQQDGNIPAGDNTIEFYLNADVSQHWENLVFPCPRGSKLYWGNPTASQATVTLVFT